MGGRRIALILLLLVSPVVPRRGGGGNNNFGRGQSGSRGNIGGAAPPPSGGGFHPPPSGGGFNPGGFQPRPQPQPHPGWNGGGGGFNGPRPGSFGGSQGRPNTGVMNNRVAQMQPRYQPGSRSSTSNFKTALLAGAAGGLGAIVAFEAGKAILHSTSFSNNGRTYYTGDQHYQGQPGMMMCSYPLSELQKTPTETTTTTVAPAVVTDNTTTTTVAPAATDLKNLDLTTLQFKDGTRPYTINFGCRQATETCCGVDCCPRPVAANPAGGVGGSSSGGSSIGSIALLAVIALLLLCCCGGFLCYKCFGGFGRRDEQYDNGYQMNNYQQQQPQHADASQGGYYPPQQGAAYPQQGGYTPQGAYPQQPAYNNTYGNYQPQQNQAYPQQHY